MAEGMLAASNRVISVLRQTQNLLKLFNWAFAQCREPTRISAESSQLPYQQAVMSAYLDVPAEKSLIRAESRYRKPPRPGRLSEACRGTDFLLTLSTAGFYEPPGLPAKIRYLAISPAVPEECRLLYSAVPLLFPGCCRQPLLTAAFYEPTGLPAKIRYPQFLLQCPSAYSVRCSFTFLGCC